MLKVIAFSLWGNNPKYTVGAIRNAELAPSVFPDWELHYYIDNTVPNQIIYALEDLQNVKIIEKNIKGDWKSAFWRFYSYQNADIVIFRDTDSRLGIREQLAVNEWLLSDKTFHVMRDHPYHKFEMLAGMWGAKKNEKYDLCKIFDDYLSKNETNFYGAEYILFKNILFPLIKDNCVVHDPFFDKKPFPSKRIGYEFVGQVFDENEKTVQEHLDVLKKALL
jgi:hypothetical protein